MPVHKSAEKRARQSKIIYERNRKVKSSVKALVKGVEKALSEKDVSKAREALRKAVSTIDSAVSKGVIHRDTAARKKSRLTLKVNRLTQLHNQELKK